MTGRLQHSRLGRAWVAIREDEIAAKAMGINTRNVKLLAFSMGASFGGVAGAMFAAFQGFVSPESFSLTESISPCWRWWCWAASATSPAWCWAACCWRRCRKCCATWSSRPSRRCSARSLIEAEVLRQLLYGLAMVLIMLNRPAGLWPSPVKEDRPLAATDKEEKEEGAVV